MYTACHIHNRVTIRTATTETLYELWKGKKPKVKYFHIFRSVCYILADREYHRKLHVKSVRGIFLGYSPNSRAYIVFNTRTQFVLETINLVVNDDEKLPLRGRDDEQAIIMQNTDKHAEQLQSDVVPLNSSEAKDDGNNLESLKELPILRLKYELQFNKLPHHRML